jgi:hypothetical protein
VRQRLVWGFVCLAVLVVLPLTVSVSQQSPASHQDDAASSPPTAEFHAEFSPKRLERGRYLVNLAHCFGCHSTDDFEHDGQPKPGTMGAGQVFKGVLVNGQPLDGMVAPNITPDKETGAGSWTDAQFERAIRHGIGHDGRELYDLMPYAFFHSMTDEDVASVIVYLRSIPAIHNPLPKMHLPFEVKRDMHPELEPPFPSNASEQVKHGWYLVRLGQCNDCHTPADDKGRPMTNMMFGGGLRFQGPFGDETTANITSDASGIAHYDTAMFIRTIRLGRASGGVRDLKPIMPFSYFRNLTDEDLAAIFAYLRTVKPVLHNVDNSEPPTYCKVCRQKHGLGYLN